MAGALTIKRLWRYPVRTADGKLGSGKNSGGKVQMDALFSLRACLANGAPDIEFPDGRVDERRFRPNLLVEVDGEQTLEGDWGGRVLTVGEVRLQVTAPTERCRMVTLAQSELPEDVRVLREIAQRQDACFGVYARVLAPGEVRVGNAVSVA